MHVVGIVKTILLFIFFKVANGFLGLTEHKNVTSTGSYLQISVPARPFCAGVGSYLDLVLRTCVTIHQKETQPPLYSPCPDNTVLKDDRCVGRHESPLELACPLRYDTNQEGQCVRMTSYTPVERVCPEGFKFRYSVRTRVRVCVKESWVPPIYVSNNISQLQCQLSGSTQCKEAVEIQCPSGHRVIKNPPAIVRDIQVLQGQSSLERTSALCYGRVILPPHSSKECTKQYRWSNKLGSCVKAELVTATEQCPWPDSHIGYGKGDVKTPRFEYDERCQCCVSSESPALHPQCPPGWALQGTWHYVCARKSFSPIQYDCENAKGFTLKWSNVTKESYCETLVDVSHYSAGVSYLTRRSKLDSFYLRMGQGPSISQSGFWLSQRANKEKKKEKNDSQDTEEMADENNTTVWTTQNLIFLQQNSRMNNNGNSSSFFFYDDSSLSYGQLQPGNTQQDLLPQFTPLGEPYEEFFEPSVTAPEGTPYDSSLPSMRQDLLDPRSPGSLSYSDKSPKSHQSKLHVYTKRRGLF